MLLTVAWASQSTALDRLGPKDDAIRPIGTVADEAVEDKDEDDGPAVPKGPDYLADPRGRFREAKLTEADQLEAIGYVSGSREAGDRVRVTRYDPERTEPGLNLYNSGHEASAILMDAEGNTLHTWSMPFETVWPDWAGPPNQNMRFWRRVHLLPDGSLLAIFEGLGLIEIDAESNLIWARPNSAHHDLDVLPDGNILTLGRRVEVSEDLERPTTTLIDYAMLLDSEGRALKRVNLLTAYGNSAFRAHVDFSGRGARDLFHTNAIRFLDQPAPPPFTQGRVLLSMRHLSTLAVLDLGSRRIVWSARGDFALQHDPHLLPNGHLLFFDNGPLPRQRSRAVEIDPGSGAVVWTYAGTEESPLWSETCGSVQRLDNGNTLITESDAGRALEVTPEGEIVWEFFNPARPDDRPELIATLFELQRLPVDQPLDWLSDPAETP